MSTPVLALVLTPVVLFVGFVVVAFFKSSPKSETF